MSIREQLASAGTPHTANGHAAIHFSMATNTTSPGYHALKRDVHETVLDRVELERLAHFPQEQVRQEIASLVSLIIEEHKVLLNDNERRQLTVEIYDEMFGFGPLEPLLKDPTVSDILVNTARQTYVERRGKLELTNVVFYDDAHLMKVIEKIVSRVGRRIDETSPMVDARLPDGSALTPSSRRLPSMVRCCRFVASP
jgi:pilus assembly protein CpaF